MGFVHERQWAQDHDPKSLLLAMMGELGEVAEILHDKRPGASPKSGGEGR